MKYAIAFVLCLISQTCFAVDNGYFGCFHLNEQQIAWFQTQPVSGCCALGDGMPIRYEQRADGIYVPPYPVARAEAASCKAGVPWQENEDHANEDRSKWIRVPETMVLKTKNLVGVGIVWWTWAGNEDDPQSYNIKCAIFGVLT